MTQNSDSAGKTPDVRKWIIARYGADVLRDIALIDDKSNAFVGIARTPDNSSHYSIYDTKILEEDVSDDGMLDYDENWDSGTESSKILFLDYF